MAKLVSNLWNKAEDLENHNRWNNIQIIGLKQVKEADCKMNKYVLNILSEGLGLTGPEFEIKCSHRILWTKPSDEQHPQVVLMEFLRYDAREKVLAEAKKNKGLDWEECKLSFFEDMLRKRAMKRKKFSMAKKLLWTSAFVTPWLIQQYPGSLGRGKKQSFTDHFKVEVYKK